MKLIFLQKPPIEDSENVIMGYKHSDLRCERLLQGENHPRSLEAVNGDREVVREAFQRELLGVDLSQVEVLEVEPVDHGEGEDVGQLGEQAGGGLEVKWAGGEMRKRFT